MEEKSLFYAYSDYLKKLYGQKVYKLPVNLPVSCPNRVNGQRGCSFCAEKGTGFESMECTISVSEQLEKTKPIMQKKYGARKFIAYFQNYTNTYLPVKQFEKYMKEAANISDIVEIAVSTRPDCIRTEYLDILKQIQEEYGCGICIELGLQTANYHTLDKVNRGHGLAEFIDAVSLIKPYNYDICTHVILNLPGDDMTDAIETARILSALKVTMVKLHSLYIAKNTILCEAYENGTITLCTKEEYIQRVIAFLEQLNPEIAVERLFSRVPEEDAVFSNWGTSWWKLKDELTNQMILNGSYQGKAFHYLNGAALERLKGEV